MENKNTKIFLNSPVSSRKAQLLNENIKSLLIEEGFECVIPQDILPPESKELSDVEIFNTNMQLIRSCDVVLSVLEKPGEGVIFELAVAHVLNKSIIIFRPNETRNLGKMIEGFWKNTPKDRKAANLEELRKILRNL